MRRQKHTLTLRSLLLTFRRSHQAGPGRNRPLEPWLTFACGAVEDLEKRSVVVTAAAAAAAVRTMNSGYRWRLWVRPKPSRSAQGELRAALLLTDLLEEIRCSEV